MRSHACCLADRRERRVARGELGLDVGLQRCDCRTIEIVKGYSKSPRASPGLAARDKVITIIKASPKRRKRGIYISMERLPLDSPRWRTLKAHFGNAGQDGDLASVPSLLAKWHEAVGAYREEYEYEDLFESYLHQRTILDVAYAVVPHLASRLTELDPDRRLEVLEDIADVDRVRIKPRTEVEAIVASVGALDLDPETLAIMVQNTRDRHATLPSDLAHAYLAAIEKAEAIGGPRWREREGDTDGSAQPRHWRRHVAYLRNVGWREADIAFAVHALRAGDLIYKLERDEAREALCALEKNVPAGWFERTRLRLSEADLGFRAVHTLAWWSSLEVDAILRDPRS